MVIFTFSVFWSEIPFLGKFGWKNQNCQSKRKIGTYSNFNIQNSMVIFTFSVFDWKYPFWANLVQKIKVISLSWNLVPTLIRICRIEWWCSLFFIFGRKYPVWDNLVQKIKIVSLRCNLIPKLIRICWIQWCCSVVLFSNGKALLGQIWSKLAIFTV